LGDKPLVLKLLAAALFLIRISFSLQVLQKGSPFVCEWGSPLGNSEIIGTHLADMFQEIKGPGKSFDKFAIGS
jgi:hypothetical protein